MIRENNLLWQQHIKYEAVAYRGRIISLTVNFP